VDALIHFLGEVVYEYEYGLREDAGYGVGCVLLKRGVWCFFSLLLDGECIDPGFFWVGHGYGIATVCTFMSSAMTLRSMRTSSWDGEIAMARLYIELGSRPACRE